MDAFEKLGGIQKGRIIFVKRDNLQKIIKNWILKADNTQCNAIPLISLAMQVVLGWEFSKVWVC